MSTKTFHWLSWIPCVALIVCLSTANAQPPAGDPDAAAPAVEPKATDPKNADPKDAAAGDPKTEPTAPTAKAEPTGPKLVIVNPEVPYKQLPFAASIKDDIRTQNDVVKIVNRVLSGDERLQENEAAFKGYFTQFLFPKMTELDPVSGLPVNDLPDIRTKFLRDFVYRAENQQARDLLIDTTYQYMWGIIRGHFHPVAQFNAMLIVGELNITEARTGGSNPAPPEPLPKALPEMVAVLSDAKQHDALRVAALIGVQRHAWLDGQKPASARMAPSRKVDIVEAVAQIMFSAKPPNRSQAGHNWMRRLAIETIGLTHDPGVGEKNAKELARILADETESRDMRLVAAVAYSRMEFQKAPAIKTADVVGQIARLIVESSRKSIESLHEEADIREKIEKGPTSEFSPGEGFEAGPGGYSSDSASEAYGDLSDPFGDQTGDSPEGGSGFEGAEGGFGDEAATLPLVAARQYHVDNIARNFVFDLRRSQIALQGHTAATKGLTGMADEKTKTAIGELTKQIKKIYEVVEEQRPEGIDKFTEELETAVLKLEETVVKVAPVPTSPTKTGPTNGLPGDETGLPGDTSKPDDSGLPGPAEPGLPG